MSKQLESLLPLYSVPGQLFSNTDFSAQNADQKHIPVSGADIFLHLFLMFLILIFWSIPAHCGENKYRLISSDLNKGLFVYKVGHVKVLAIKVTTKKNDYLWKIFDRSKVLGKKMDSVRLVELFKKLNPSIKDWDIIIPGQQLIIPIRIIRSKLSATNKRINHANEPATACRKKPGIPAGQKSTPVCARPKPDKNIPPAAKRATEKILTIVNNKKVIKNTKKGTDAPYNKNRPNPHKQYTKHRACKLYANKKDKTQTPLTAKHRRQLAPMYKETDKKDYPADNYTMPDLSDSHILLPPLCMQSWPATPFHASRYLCKKGALSHSITAKQHLPVSAKKEKGRADKVIESRKKTICNKLSEIFHRMGGEWTQSGEHFISLKSGGQLNLDAKSYPLVNFNTGTMVIVDLHNSLPEELIRVIRSNWDNYRFVHLNRKDNLQDALHKIFNRCGFSNVLKKGEAYEFENNGIKFSIKADWIMIDTKNSRKNRPRVLVLNLKKNNIIPTTIKRYIKGLNVMSVDYPGQATPEITGKSPPCWQWNGTFGNIAEKLLVLQGITFKSKTNVPVYRNQRHDFNLTVVADLLFRMKGKDAIIDFKALSPETVSLLRKNKYIVLPLAEEKNGLGIVKKILDFLDVKYTPGPVSFKTADSSPSNNLEITLPGITFLDHDRNMVLATTVPLPDEIAAFLWQRGYYVLTL